MTILMAHCRGVRNVNEALFSLTLFPPVPALQRRLQRILKRLFSLQSIGLVIVIVARKHRATDAYAHSATNDFMNGLRGMERWPSSNGSRSSALMVR